MFIGADNCYSQHHFLALRENFKPNLPLYNGHSTFLLKSKYKLLFNFQMFLFDRLLCFSSRLITLLYLVTYQEFLEFP